MQRMRGFTLVELIVAMVVAGVVAAIAIPNFRLLILNQQSEAIGEELISSFQFARSEAIKRSGFVTVCPSNTGTSCGGSWGNGLLIIVDGAVANGASIDLQDSADRLNYIQFTNDEAVINASGPAFVRYNSRGMMVNAATGVTFDLTSYVTGCKGDYLRAISIGRAGMISSDWRECPGA